MADRFVVVHRTFDPIEVEVVLELLARNGIDARGLGTRHGALIGVGQGILEQRVEVPEDRAAEAAELIAAFVRSGQQPLPATDPAPEGPVEPAHDGEPQEPVEPAHDGREAPVEPARDAEPEEPAEPALPRLRPILAAGSVLSIFGGSHFYARRTASGLVIAASQVAALALAALFASDELASRAAVLVALGLLALDLVGGQLAVRAFNRGHRVSRSRQLAISLAAALLITGGAALVARMVPPPAPEPSELDSLLPLLPGPGDQEAQGDEIFRILQFGGLPGLRPSSADAADAGAPSP